MTRCFPLIPLRRTVAHTLLYCGLAMGLASLHTTAQAQQAAIRPFPAKSQLGTMVITQPPDLLLDGKSERLSPGARIRGSNNMLVMSGTLVGQELLVVYMREPMGLIHQVWILNEAEAQLARANAR